MQFYTNLVCFDLFVSGNISEWHVSLRKVNIYALKKTLTENLDNSSQNIFLLHLVCNLKRRIFLFSTEIYHHSSKACALTGRAGRGGGGGEKRAKVAFKVGKINNVKNLIT